MSPRTRVLFALVVVALGAWFFIEQPRWKQSEQNAEDAARLVSYDAERVDGVVIRRRDATLTFSIVGAHWEMRRPVSDLAEHASLASLLSSLANASSARDLGASEDLVRYGLASPAVRLRLTAGPDTLASLDLGDFTVDRAHVYARRSDGTVVLAPTSLVAAASLPVDDFRNRRVIAFDRTTVQGFDLITHDEESRWMRGEGGAWFTVSAGDTIAGDSIEVEAVLRTLHGLRVTSILAAPDTAGAMRDPDCVLVLRRATGPPDAVRFRCPAHGPCLAQRNGESRVVAIDHDLLSLREGGVATLRDRRVLHFAPEDAARIEVVTPDTSAVLVRAGDTWGLPNPALGRVDPRLAADFVRTLRGLRWSAQGGEPAPVGGDRFSVVITDRNGRRMDGFESRVTKDRSEAVGPAGAAKPAFRIPMGTVSDITLRLRRMKASG